MNGKNIQSFHSFFCIRCSFFWLSWRIIEKLLCTFATGIIVFCEMYMKIILFIVCIPFLLYGCGNTDKDKDLFSALSVNIELRPDSVLQELDSLRKTTSLSKINEARWNLWYVQAFEEKSYTLPSDSIVLVATDILCKEGSLREQAYSYFYLGRLYADQKDEAKMNDALAYYLEALKLAEKIKEYRLAGLICNYMNRIYIKENRYDKGSDILKRAVQFFCKSGNVRSQIFSLNDISHNFLYKHLPDSALLYCAKAELLARQINDEDALAKIWHEQAASYWLEKDFKSAEYYIKKAMDITVDSVMKEKEILLYIDINIGLKKYDVAKKCFLPFLEEENPSLLERASNSLYLSQIEEGLGNYRLALKYNKEYMELSDSLINRKENINTLKVELEAENKKLLQEISYLGRIVIIWVVLSFILFVVCCILFFFYHKRVKQICFQEKEIGKLKEEQQNLKNELLTNSEQLHKMSLLSCTPSHKQKELKEEMKKFFLSSEITPDDWSKLEGYLNLSQDGFVEKLRTTYPTLSEDEVHMLILIRLGWDNNQLAVFYDIKMETVMTKRSRARGKMKLKREADLENFIQNLFNQ